MHIRRHGHVFVAFAAGGLAYGLIGPAEPPALRALLAASGFFLVYLAFAFVMVTRGTPDRLKARAEDEDEGLPLILLLLVAANALSLWTILVLLRQAEADGAPGSALIAAGVVPLGWLTLHTSAAFHYANLYYAPRGRADSAPCLGFPGGADPDAWDFLYFSFVIGMTAQVSDVAVQTSRLRRVVLLHGVAAFFYNTVILALVVNAVLAFAG